MAGVLGASSAKADDWLRLYDAANESAKSIQDGIQESPGAARGPAFPARAALRGQCGPLCSSQERAQLIRQGKQPAKLSAGLRQRLGQLATLTDELEVKLDRDESREVSKQEKSRRRDMISILRMRRTQVRASVTCTVIHQRSSPCRKTPAQPRKCRRWRSSWRTACRATRASCWEGPHRVLPEAGGGRPGRRGVRPKRPRRRWGWTRRARCNYRTGGL